MARQSWQVQAAHATDSLGRYRPHKLTHTLTHSLGRYNFGVLTSGKDLSIPESSIDPVASLPNYEDLTSEDPALLKECVIVKLNGGLGEQTLAYALSGCPSPHCTPSPPPLDQEPAWASRRQSRC